MDMADDMDTNIGMVVRLKWCVEALCTNMKGQWVSSHAGSSPSPQAQLGTFLQEVAHSFWLAQDQDLYLHLGRHEEQAPVALREAIRQKLREIGSDALPQLKNLYVTQCDGLIQNLSSEIPEQVERDAMGRPVLVDGAERTLKKPVEIAVMFNAIILYLLNMIRANLHPPKVRLVHLPRVEPHPRHDTHIQSLLRQLTQL